MTGYSCEARISHELRSLGGQIPTNLPLANHLYRAFQVTRKTLSGFPKSDVRGAAKGRSNLLFR